MAGGKVLLSEGGLILASTIRMPVGKPVIIEGQGEATVFSGASAFQADGPGSVGHVFADFVIDGCTEGFRFTFLESILWQNIEVKNSGGDAFGGAGDGLVEGTFIRCIARDNGGMGFGIGIGSYRCNLFGCLADGNGGIGFTFDGARDSAAFGCVAKDNGQIGMELEASPLRCKYIGGTSIGNTGWGVDAASGTDCLVSGVAVNGNVAGQILPSAGVKIRDCAGYVNENSGTGTIPSAGPPASVAVAHGCDYTPAAADIVITPTENPTNTPGLIWVDTIGAANFTVNCENDPGASALDFSWAVRRV